jgi:uncharacterized protein YdeI (YjbR/CyaY-like superfamily)
MPAVGKTLRPRTREAWRAWLERNAGSAREIWLLLAKKHVGAGWLGYDEAVEEALCEGWVDGLTKRFDEDFRAVRFTPRRPGSIWSMINRRRVAKLLREGRMKERGLALVRHAKRTGAWQAAYQLRTPGAVPPELAAALDAVPTARAFFETLAPSQRSMCALRVSSAKRPETRARRIAGIVERCARGERPL